MTKKIDRKPGRPPGSTKEKLSPEAQRLADLKGKKAVDKAARQKRTAGMIDRGIELGFEAAARKRPHWQLSPAEKEMIRDANQAILAETGLGILQDPKILFTITYGIILLPRIIIEVLDYREKRSKKPAERKPERPAKPDNSHIREKGPGQDNPDLEGLSTPAPKNPSADL